MYCVYLLKSLSKEETYIGSTNNLKGRFVEHNLGKVTSTKRYRPWRLLYYEAYIDERLAHLREQRLKSNGNAIRELKKRVGLIKDIKKDLSSAIFSLPKSGEGFIQHHFSKQKSGAGFTLIEITVVMGLLAAIAGLASFGSLDTWRGYNFRGERNLLISILQEARSQSVNNICLGTGCDDGRPHGVHIQADQYIIFQGSAYDPADPLNEVIGANNSIAHGGLTDVVFSQLSGNVSAPGDIVISDAIRTVTISINNEGRINY